MVVKLRKGTKQMLIKFYKTDGDYVSINPNFVVSVEWGLLNDEDFPTTIVTTKDSYQVHPQQNVTALNKLCGDGWDADLS